MLCGNIPPAEHLLRGVMDRRLGAKAEIYRKGGPTHE